MRRERAEDVGTCEIAGTEDTGNRVSSDWVRGSGKDVGRAAVTNFFY